MTEDRLWSRGRSRSLEDLFSSVRCICTEPVPGRGHFLNCPRYQAIDAFVFKRS